MAEGWLKPGDVVLDCFGGVSLGALDCMSMGMHHVAVELEPRFVALGQQNIARWNARYSTLPGWGTATILQGDSRQLAALVGEAAACVSSPPYAETPVASYDGSMGDTWRETGMTPRQRTGGRLINEQYGTDPANLGNMKAGDFDACLASPPYAESIHDGCGIDWTGTHRKDTDNSVGFSEGYGTTPGQLGAMPAGGFDSAISSPPYVSGGHHPDQTGAWGGEAQSVPHDLAGYGKTDGQLGQMPAGGFEAAVSSPPYEHTDLSCGTMGLASQTVRREAARFGTYGDSEGQLGASDTIDFWTAARAIVEQVYLVLKPGAHAVWVLKAYVRDKKVVDFPDQWRQMCEACGFETLHVHRAWLVEEHGGQATLEGGVKRLRKKRVSFFRRLAEAKGCPEINWEVVLCQRKAL